MPCLTCRVCIGRGHASCESGSSENAAFARTRSTSTPRAVMPTRAMMSNANRDAAQATVARAELTAFGG
jgi:hypothetical protein